MKKIITIVLLFSILLISIRIVNDYQVKEIDKKIMCLNMNERIYILENEANINEKTKSEEDIKSLFNVIGFVHHRTLEPYSYKKIDDKIYDIFYKDENYDMNIEKCKNYENKYKQEFFNLKNNLNKKKECFNMNIIYNYFDLRKDVYKNNLDSMNKFISINSGKNYEKLFNKDLNGKDYTFILENNSLDIINSGNFSKNKNCLNK